MWDLHVVKTVKKGKIDFSIRDIYFNQDGTVGAVAARPYHIKGNTLKEIYNEIKFLNDIVTGRSIVIHDCDTNKFYTKHNDGSTGVIN